MRQFLSAMSWATSQILLETNLNTSAGLPKSPCNVSGLIYSLSPSRGDDSDRARTTLPFMTDRPKSLICRAPVSVIKTFEGFKSKCRIPIA